MYLVILFVFSLSAVAKKNITYKYKKYEKFDFEKIDVSGSIQTPGDLSISPRFTKKFRNKIPSKKNFNREMKRAVFSIK